MDSTDRSNQAFSSVGSTTEQPPTPTKENLMQIPKTFRLLSDAEVAAEIKAIDSMEITELKEYYLELFGAPTYSKNKAHLRKRLAYRIQEINEGDLSQRALDRIEELSQNLPERWRYPRKKGAEQAEPTPQDVEALDSTPEEHQLEKEEPPTPAPSAMPIPQLPEVQPALPFKFPVMKPSADVSAITVTMNSPKGDLSLIFDLADLKKAQ
jgi:hypothetical protein